MSKEEMMKYLKENCFAYGMTDEDIKKAIQEDYESLIELRNRLNDTENDTVNDTVIYEEDHITLDHCLDYMELFMAHLKLGKIGG
ncbi:MAG: hypothetical protein J6J36_06700 [Clostridia bacterium]|nr:hypothetical protein [Clostridia bacterium]